MAGIIRSYRGITPRIGPDVFIADNAVVIGDVEIGAGTSIWYGCVIRGDAAPIRIGSRTNLQDGTIVHVNGPRSTGTAAMPTHIGDDITVGHAALIHACTLQSRCFIGMRSVILDLAVVETGAMVAAGAVVGPGKVVKEGELWSGVPAKLFRNLRPEEVGYFAESVRTYVDLAGHHMATEKPV
ncbi:MAG: gamma carbonic anhydrase family protein [Alphaproteobacteria bacterium]|nr:gamma carbonic anhydrase family protein [Alphaproteobacteria bacterium]